MKSFSFAKYAILCAFATSSSLAWTPFASAQVSPASGHSFRVEGDHFIARRQALPVISGEMHYARMPREYWRDRLRNGQGHGPQHHHHLRLLERPRAAAPASTTSPATTTSPSSSAKPSRKASTSSSAPAPTSAPSGTSAAIPAGCSKIAPWWCAAPIRSSSKPRRAGSPSRPGTCPAANRPWRSHHRRAGRKRVRLLRQ